MKHSICSILVCALSVVAAAPAWAYDFEQDGLYYSFLSSGERKAMLTTGEIPYSGDLVVPSKVQYRGILEFSVDSIQDDIFRGNDNLTSIVVSPEIKMSVGNYSFRYCTNLNRLVLPKSVTSVGRNAFDGCCNLMDFELPQDVSSIGPFAFMGCSSLKQMTIPSQVSEISESLFLNCTNLNKVVLSPFTESIGANAFCNCISLASVDLPASVARIGRGAFYNCVNLKKVNYATVRSLCEIVFADEYANPLSYAEQLLIDNSEIGDVRIPEGVEGIGDFAFYNAPITGVHMPSTIASLGVSAFQGCNSLIAVEVSEGVRTIANAAFFNCTNLQRVVLPSRLISVGDDAFTNCSGLKTLILEDGSEEIVLGVNSLNGNKSLFSSSKLDSLYLGRNMKFDNAPFRDQTNLRVVVLGETVDRLSDYAFHECSSLTDVYSKRMIPVALATNVFFSTAFNTVMIHISKGAEEAYVFADRWRDFLHYDVIEEWPRFFFDDPSSSAQRRRARRR